MINKALQELKRHYGTIEDVLETYKRFNHLSFEEGISFSKPSKKGVEIPSIKLAKPEEAQDIAKIFENVYKGTYSYPEMEDLAAIQKLIQDPNFGLVVFKLQETVIGCAGYRVNLERKTGAIHGFVIRKEYHGISSLVEISIASLYTVLRTYHKKILVWGAEVRSRHTKSQYLGKFFGFLPLAFLPNKDYFYNQEESEIMYVLYDKHAISKFRDYRIPLIPTNPQQYRCYYYAHKKLGLDVPFDISPSSVRLDKVILKTMQSKLRVERKTDTYGNVRVKFCLKGTDSKFSFFHNRKINNAERTHYEVSSPEELACFLKEVRKYIMRHNLRYFECYVSAYDVTDQILFLRSRFRAVGYLPAFHYDLKTGTFGDQVAYVYCKNPVNVTNLRLLEEPQELLEIINPEWRI